MTVLVPLRVGFLCYFSSFGTGSGTVIVRVKRMASCPSPSQAWKQNCLGKFLKQRKDLVCFLDCSLFFDIR